ncbi:MAG: methyltransferase domain-containing protein [Acetobacteraceae bacterium]
MSGRPADHGTPGLLRSARGTAAPDAVSASVDRYHALYQGQAGQRRRDYTSVVNTYYDLVTDFYEYGWGQSFHFAPRARGETFRESILRHEQWLALRLGLVPGSQVLDVGCGVGGPMRTIARFADCHITGLNNNDYQVERARLHNRRAGLDARCTVVKGDFMAMPFPADSFDAAYAIEATVHAPRLAGAYAEVARVLKPGGMLASYEWAMTPRFDPAEPEHRRLRAEIEFTTGIVHLSTAAEVEAAVVEAGLELLQFEDRFLASEVSWLERLEPAKNPFALRRSSGIGKHFTTAAVRVLEALRVAPRGSTTVARLLEQSGEVVVAAGQAGIFTPGLLVVARKPAS